MRSERSASGPTRVEQLLAQQGAHRSVSRDAELLDPGAQPLDELLGRADADVGGEQGLLDLLPGRVVEPVAGQQGEQAAAEGRLRAAEPGAQPGQPAGHRLGRLGAGGRCGRLARWCDDLHVAGRLRRPLAGALLEVGQRRQGGLARPRPAPAAAQQREAAPDEDGEPRAARRMTRVRVSIAASLSGGRGAAGPWVARSVGASAAVSRGRR